MGFDCVNSVSLPFYILLYIENTQNSYVQPETYFDIRAINKM